MNRFRLAISTVRHSWRRQPGRILGSAVATAVLVGALVVGDSVRASLRRAALERIGQIDAVLAPGDRLFRAQLADRLEERPEIAIAAPMIELTGLASSPDGSRRARGLSVLGVDARFFSMQPASEPPKEPPKKPNSEPARGASDAADNARSAQPAPGKAFLNDALAAQLNAEVGDTIVLRVQKPSALPRELALSEDEDDILALRVQVADILGPDRMGRFSLQSRSIPPFVCVLALDWLGGQIERGGRANRIAIQGSSSENGSPQPPAETAAVATRVVGEQLTLEDLELVIEEVDGDRSDISQGGGATAWLTSRRVFLDQAIGAAIQEAAIAGAEGVLTYFVNTLAVGDREVPYSTVGAYGPLSSSSFVPSEPLAPGSISSAAGAQDDARGPAESGATITRWLQDELAAEIGDDLVLRYFLLGPDLKLSEQTARFPIVAVVDDRHGSAHWMPEFPGLKDSENCRDWEPGIPVDLDRIRDQDEAWWDTHGGAPKAFLPLKAGQALWSNAHGDLTAVRVPIAERDALAAAIGKHLDPSAIGFQLRDVRTDALASSAATTDFGGLFLGLSMFLIAAAVLLTTLLFTLSAEERAAEIGTLRAIGFAPGVTLRLLLAEVLWVAVPGALIGAWLGCIYTEAVLKGLATIWKDAVAGTHLEFAVTPLSLIVGIVGSLIVSVGSIAYALRKMVRRPITQLLGTKGGISATATARPGRRALIAGIFLVLAAIAMLGVGRGQSGPAAAGSFFGAGSALLIAGLLFARGFLIAIATRERHGFSFGGLGLSNGARRTGRSVATIALLATGSFLVLAIGVNRLGPPADPTRRDSGTGGFQLIGQTSLPVHENLSTPVGLDAFGLAPEDLLGAQIVSLRQKDGDEASCLSLGKAQMPQLFGVDPEALASRGAFTFADSIAGLAATESPWTLLRAGRSDPPGADADDGIIPAIGDTASVTWALHKKLGETLTYRDEQGREFKVRIVATVAPSILQGMLLIDEAAFRARFPSVAGYRRFLIDAAPDQADAVSKRLTRNLEDVGLELTDTRTRLIAFQAIQNTYLAIFQVLGGLGVLLGTLGLAMVVLRNALERRAELALLRAVGFSRGRIRWLLLVEHGALLLLGLAIGAVAAGTAVVPARTDALSAVGLYLAAGIAACGVLSVALASIAASVGELLPALRDE